MSGYRYDHEESSIRSGLSGAYRPSANPRLHAVAKPYSRPSSYSGPSSQPILNGNGGLGGSPTKAITKSTRPPPTSNSSGSLTRSGSDSSLFSGLKSIFSRPLQWLAPPSRAIVTPGGTKRDSYSSFGQDVEDPESPNDRHEGKRIRRTSPRLGGDYAPTAFEVEGRAVSGYMLPALPPHLSLAPRAQGIDKPLPNRTNFSRPLNMPTSKSMPYLDPPTNLLGSSRRRGMGSMSRSRRMDMTGFGDEDDDMGGVKTMSKGKGKEMETHDDKNRDMEDGWSPRKNRSAFVKQSTTSNRATPSRNFEPRDVSCCCGWTGVNIDAIILVHPPFTLALQDPAIPILCTTSNP